MDHIGGQALIEGVMMRSKDHVSMAVRTPGGRISHKVENISSVRDRFPILKKPLVRGVVLLYETIVLGIRGLTFSANESMGENEEELSTKELVLTLGSAFGLSILMFVVLPFVVSKLLTKTDLWFQIVDGILRIVVFVAYILVISFLPDVRVMFQYHGAEHKTINCHESKKPLTIKNIQSFSTIHTRCGTSFLIFVILISIIVFSLVRGNWYVQLIYRLIMIPVIAGLSYELLKLTDKYASSFFFINWLTMPGRFIQKITTQEPTDDQVAVAKKALMVLLKV